jgi:predicted nucleic acid-binding protein
MVVVADTSPLNYLLLVGKIDLLPALYDSLLLPPAVRREMLAPLAPATVKQWAEMLPDWIEVRDPGPTTLSLHPKLNAGEREAIMLAHKTPNALLLIDEALGRQAAQHLGLNINGTLGILLLAHRRGLVDLPTEVAKLRQTSFQASDALIESVLNSAKGL